MYIYVSGPRLQLWSDLPDTEIWMLVYFEGHEQLMKRRLDFLKYFKCVLFTKKKLFSHTNLACVYIVSKLIHIVFMPWPLTNLLEGGGGGIMC